MGRKEAIARSVALAIAGGTGSSASNGRPLGLVASILSLFSTVFSLWQLVLHKIRPADFSNMRRERWAVEDATYADSFQPHGGGRAAEEALHAIGDMGFSGSTFYATADQKYLVKSVPRRSEYSFFRDDLLTLYVEYMALYQRSLLVRICDFLGSSRLCLGRILGLAPSHHIVMENIMYGQEEASQHHDGSVEWEHWDLKPTSYFYPERDIADGRLTSEATKNQLADEFHDKIRLSRDVATDFLMTLEQDTKLLADHNAVDYSLFLVRMKVEGAPVEQVADPTSGNDDLVPDEPPAIPPSAPSWRTGVPSSDGKHVFRAAILDFFWAKHKVQPMLMTALITLWNVLVSRHGHMSITTTPDEYRERFLKMCREIVEIEEDSEGASADQS